MANLQHFSTAEMECTNGPSYKHPFNISDEVTTFQITFQNESFVMTSLLLSTAPAKNSWKAFQIFVYEENSVTFSTLKDKLMGTHLIPTDQSIQPNHYYIVTECDVKGKSQSLSFMMNGVLPRSHANQESVVSTSGQYSTLTYIL